MSESTCAPSKPSSLRTGFWILVPVAILITLIVANSLRPVPVDQAVLGNSRYVHLKEVLPVTQFDLVDQLGNRVTHFEPDWTLVFFGFTYCPDVCPTTLGVLKQLNLAMGDEAPGVVFVTVDPEQDSPLLLSQYLSAFDPAFRGLTGDVSELQQLARQLHVVFEETADGVNHTTNIALIDPSGRYVGYFGIPHRAKEMSLVLEALRK